jgi:uncharacterized membrane protein YjgN (DUF898 family)
MMGYLVLTIVTLGIARPVGDVALHRYLTQHTWFGSQKFEFDGRAGQMMGKWILTLLLAPITLGLSLIWYAAFRMRYLQGQTRYQGIRFSLSVTGKDLLRIYTPYMLAIPLLFAAIYGTIFAIYMPTEGLPDQTADIQTWMQANGMLLYGISIGAGFIVFGLITPVLRLVLLTHRFASLIADRLAFLGDVDLDRVMQSAAERPESGEGLADALDVGGALEVGI